MDNERRSNLRLDRAFTVYLMTEEGIARGVARNISQSGLFVETATQLDLGARVRVTFTSDGGQEMSANCEVRYQVALNASAKGDRVNVTRGAGLRIRSWERASESALGQRAFH